MCKGKTPSQYKITSRFIFHSAAITVSHIRGTTNQIYFQIYDLFVACLWIEWISFWLVTLWK